MKFLLFNFVTGGALVYLVLAGCPPSVAIEGSQPVRTVSATAASDPGQQGGGRLRRRNRSRRPSSWMLI